MSKENAAAFLTQVDQDKALQEKVKSLGSGAVMDELVDVAAGAGYRFTPEELIEAGKDRAEAATAASGELSDEELEAVAGGSNYTVKVTSSTVHITELPDAANQVL